MKQQIILLVKYAFVITIFIVIIGCASAPKSESAAAEFTGVWKLQEAYLMENISNHYMVINSDDTAEIWMDYGLEALGVLVIKDGVLHWINTNTPPEPSRDGLDMIAEYTREGDILKCLYYPEDRSWQFVQVFDKVDKLPVFTYNNDFEDNSLKYFLPQQYEDKDEWQIIEEPGNPENMVLAPLYADQNSDAEIIVYTGKNFSIEFDYKQTKNSDTDENCWMALDFFPYTRPDGNYNPFWLNSDFPGSFSSGDRGEDYTEQSYNVKAMNWDTWHTLKVTVRDGKHFEFFLDGDLFGEREIGETLFTGFKIEGNPVTGVWYMDNLNIVWNEVD